MSTTYMYSTNVLHTTRNKLAAASHRSKSDLTDDDHDDDGDDDHDDDDSRYQQLTQ